MTIINFLKDCHEVLCSDYCLNSLKIFDGSCLKNCRLFYLQSERNEDKMLNTIIKRHHLYQSKSFLLNEQNRLISSSANFFNLNATNVDAADINRKNFKYSEITSTKQKIEILKKQILIQENNLLNLYKDIH